MVLRSDKSFELVEADLVPVAGVDVLELHPGVVLAHVDSAAIVEAGELVAVEEAVPVSVVLVEELPEVVLGVVAVVAGPGHVSLVVVARVGSMVGVMVGGGVVGGVTGPHGGAVGDVAGVVVRWGVVGGVAGLVVSGGAVHVVLELLVGDLAVAVVVVVGEGGVDVGLGVVSAGVHELAELLAVKVSVAVRVKLVVDFFNLVVISCHFKLLLPPKKI